MIRKKVGRQIEQSDIELVRFNEDSKYAKNLLLQPGKIYSN